MENSKREGLKNKLESFINERLQTLKKEREEKRFAEEIGEVNEFENLKDNEENIEQDFSEEEVHKLELDLNEMEEHIKEVAEDIKLIDDMLKIKCKINDVERYLVNELNCNIKPIALLNVALITPINIRIVDLELNDHMESVMDITLQITVELDEGKLMYIATDVRTLYSLGLLTAVDSLFAEIELSPIELRGIITPVGVYEFEQLLKFSANIE